ncbi:hypothetical protein I79_013009 [Cricetulus griseus]|uniref:Uncharacterized protein n=1 Tax=Cricetulus griseus TaxID=10029 RepID=G3HQB2_CRIGR|nr:hypothetical protein I79_013009 [Cricetulus griseus]
MKAFSLLREKVLKDFSSQREKSFPQALAHYKEAGPNPGRILWFRRGRSPGQPSLGHTWLANRQSRTSGYILWFFLLRKAGHTWVTTLT